METRCEMKAFMPLLMMALSLTALSLTAAAGVDARGVADAAQETYRLASAQVVTASDRPPVLKLTATGPIAFALLSEDGEQQAAPNRLIARLYGVAPDTLAAPGGLSPFTVSIRAAGGTMDSDAIVTITTSGLPAGQALMLRQGARSNELEVVIATASP
jgi:hypothetical protein